MRVLALSSSRVGNGGYLAAAAPAIGSFLGISSLQVAFVPFAAVDGDYEAYAARVREGLSAVPHTIQLVTAANGKDVIAACDVIMVGGGNTFQLLHAIYRHGLFDLIRQRVQNGIPYIGWSAGANLAGRTLCTTNDMPIIQPESFTSFGFLPFQVNPHYYHVLIEGFHGETRDQRLSEFCQLHPRIPVVGLPEGTALLLAEGKLHYQGPEPGVLFESHSAGRLPHKTELSPGADLSFLLQAASAD